VKIDITGRRSRIALALAATAAIGLSTLVAVPASAQENSVTDAVFSWGINNESNSAAYFGGCNFLSAGAAGDAGSSRLWSNNDGFFKASDGNVTIVKPTADGGVTNPTWASKCLTPAGVPVNMGANTNTGSRVEISNGTGTVDSATGAATINWTGDFTVVYYGGMTYWTASNPVLTVGADGTGTVTATASGYAASMDDNSIWQKLTPTQITLAQLTGVQVTATGFTATPDYLGVTATGDGIEQTPKTTENQNYWGSFPSDFLEFQVKTGQNSYWYSSGGAVDVRKPTLPLSVSFTAAPAALSISEQPSAAQVALGSTATFSVGTAGGGGTVSYDWQSSTDGNNWISISGATASSYSVTANSSTAKSYRVIVSDGTTSVTSAAAALTVDVPTPTVTVSKTSGLSPEGETITVTGTGFFPNPTLTNAIRLPLAGKFGGAYVAFGKFAPNWKPSEGAAGSARAALASATKWGVSEADVTTIDPGKAGTGIVIAADGTFSTTLTVSQGFAGALANGNYGIYTYSGGGASYKGFETYTPLSFQPKVDRIAGDTRIEAAVGISQAGFPNTADAVFIATGYNYPDALSAAPAAAKAGAPLLLTQSDELPAAVKKEIQRLSPKKIVIIGGLNSVSDKVAKQLGALADTVDRVGGADRFETSLNVVNYAFSAGDSTEAYVATGANFPDALSAGAAAGSKGAPVLLVDGNGGAVKAPIKSALSSLGITKVSIAGGPSSVSAAVESSLRSVSGVTTVNRLAGSDRFQSSIAINRDGFGASKQVYLATGYNYPDALAGAVLAGAQHAPLYVVPTDCVTSGVLADLKSLDASKVTLLGGESALNPTVASLKVCGF
jgi:putative cell wall-binding protein